jgi:hypothetical protein
MTMNIICLFLHKKLMAKYSIFFLIMAATKMPRASSSKMTAPPRLSLKRVSESSDSPSSTPPTKEKKLLSAQNFLLFVVYCNEFMQMHPGVESFLGEQMKNFKDLLETKFFEWLNYRKNSQKILYEIKREFMCIADAVLLYELGNHQRRLTQLGFVIGPFQVTLQQMAASDDPVRFGVIPYSKPLHSPPISKLDDSRLQIREEEMRLAGLEPFDVDNRGERICDVSHFFA